MRKNEERTIVERNFVVRSALWDTARKAMDVQPSYIEGQTFYKAHQDVRIAVVLQAEHVFWGVRGALKAGVKHDGA